MSKLIFDDSMIQLHSYTGPRGKVRFQLTILGSGEFSSFDAFELESVLEGLMYALHAENLAYAEVAGDVP